jgi:arylsulfatase A-like enzyme
MSRFPTLPLLLLCACGGKVEAGGPRPSSAVHLLSAPHEVTKWPNVVLPGGLHPLLEQEYLVVRSEFQRANQWGTVPGSAPPEGFVHLRAPYKLPFLGQPCIRSRSEANDPEAGRPLPEGGDYLPKLDELVLGPEGLEVLQPADDPWPPRLRYAYLTSCASILEALCGEPPQGDSPATVLELPTSARRVRYAPTPARLTWSLQVPPNGKLRLGYGLRELAFRWVGTTLELRSPPSQKEAEGAVTFVVTVAGEGEGIEREVWSETVGVARADEFHDVAIDLAEWAGRPVRLGLETSTGALPDRCMPFWAEPVLDGDRPGDDRPNIIVVLLDTLRADRLGCYGGERVGLTPALDALARRGVRFHDTMSAGPCTLPSHASLFSSLYGSEHGVYFRERLPDEVVTVAEVLRDGGYQTHAQTEGIFVHHEFGLAQGFDTFTVGSTGIRATFTAAMDRVRDLSGPFFLFLHTYEAHIPYAPPEALRKRWVRPYDGPFTEATAGSDLKAGPEEIVPADVQYLRDLYDAEIAFTDRWVGRWVTFMEEQGWMEESLLVVTSDHGDEFHEHGGFNHGHSLYQEQLRVPLILYQAGKFEGGVKVEHTVHGVDLAPSLALAAGIQPPDAWRGAPLSLTPPETSRPLFTPFRTLVSNHRTAAWRVGSMKLISFREESGEFDPMAEAQLYDLSQDPGEQVNLWPPEADEDRAKTWLERLEDQFSMYPLRSEAQSVQAGHEADIQAMGYAGD